MHPAVSPEGAGPATKFRSLKDLRRALESQHGLQFCTICLAGRKVDPHSNPSPDMAPIGVRQALQGAALPFQGAAAVSCVQFQFPTTRLLLQIQNRTRSSSALL